MLYYQITCKPDGKIEMALSAPTTNFNPLVIAKPDIKDARQLWELVGFAAVDEDGKAFWNAFNLFNKHTGRVAQAPHTPEEKVAPDTRPVSQADIKDNYNIASGIRLWTLDPDKAGFAIRPLGDVHQNLNAWDGLAEPGIEVGIWKWQGGKPNEIWGFHPVWL
jgi:hypothetical protein